MYWCNVNRVSTARTEPHCLVGSFNTDNRLSTAARFTIVWSTATTLSRRQVSVRCPDSLFDTSSLSHLCSLTSEHSVFRLPTVGFHYLPSSGRVCELTSRFLRSCNSSHIQKRCFWVSFSNQTSYVSTPTW